MKDKFNKYCAEVMSFTLEKNPYSESGLVHYIKGDGWCYYNPYDDLNQMLPIADKKIAELKQRKYAPVLTELLLNLTFHDKILEDTIRDFITSTMEKDSE